MKPGDRIRLRGPAGAPFMVTVGPAFTEQDITQRLATGEWRHLDDDMPAAAPAAPAPVAPAAPAEVPPVAKADPNRPPVSAPKAAWIDHVVASRLMSRDDAANYTKADLIDMVS